ncbi:MAG: dynamin family protein [gamma proteobacterium symbiont of Lucinoma myriamae]|nr:dynamin family protein [gamma proteobacterium symbiont of Lucinoma myriamae]MCU7818739.1 dynamin family protein [gamma proteobacterium symbiont of Lucinoma myriamae]
MFFAGPSTLLKSRLQSLQDNLASENPILIDAVDSFKELDIVAYRLGLLTPDQSFATTISWWPLITVLGTFSAGKSSFINSYLDVDLQLTGNQAVDDKFTVVCYSQEDKVRVLPGLALDADPRLPFYQISEEIEKVSAGEGSRIDTYLQLKTCKSDALKGKILIDSPGFDADEQRNATLKITDHIIDLADLVLVFFDARHPEPGAMKDTLQHLVEGTIRRNDAGKFLFILNQMDCTAKEDNAEQVVAAWQRAVVQTGLSTGRFYCVYNEKVAPEIEDEHLRERYKNKLDIDMGEIEHRMQEVSVERVYRIIGALENTANQIEQVAVPQIKDAMDSWYRSVLITDGILYGLLTSLLVAISIYAGYWVDWSFQPSWLESFKSSSVTQGIVLSIFVVVFGSIHFWARRFIAKRVVKKLPKENGPGNIAAAFLKNTHPLRSVFAIKPAGWGRRGRKAIERVRNEADNFVKALNDNFADPLGRKEAERIALEEENHKKEQAQIAAQAVS